MPGVTDHLPFTQHRGREHKAGLTDFVITSSRKPRSHLLILTDKQTASNPRRWIRRNSIIFNRLIERYLVTCPLEIGTDPQLLYFDFAALWPKSTEERDR